MTIFCLLRQPSRAIWWLCLANNIKHELVPVQIAKGEHRSIEFSKVNPMMQVPAIDDNGFILAESHAILRYLCNSRADLVADHWYPRQDVKLRARIDQYLDWHHSNLRKGAAGLVMALVFAPTLKLKLPPHAAEEAAATLKRSLKMMDNWLKSSKYLAGDRISIADISAFCEIAQLDLLPSFSLTSYPHVNAWSATMRSQPQFAQTHAVIVKIAAKRRATASASASDEAVASNSSRLSSSAASGNLQHDDQPVAKSTLTALITPHSKL